MLKLLMRRGCESSRILPIQRGLGLANTVRQAKAAFTKIFRDANLGGVLLSLVESLGMVQMLVFSCAVRGNFVETCTMWQL